MNSILEGNVGYFCIGQVCENGHPITGYYDKDPEFRRSHCPDCGASTLTQCPSCASPIAGNYYAEYMVVNSPFIPPRFCDNCGSAYPWTARALAAAHDAIDMADELDEKDRAKAKTDIDALVQQAPGWEVAAQRLKRFLGGATQQVVFEAIGNVLGEAVKRVIFP